MASRSVYKFFDWSTANRLQILGIGDQGVGAILISIAKLAIYTLCAGIHPARTLPVVLDCGTNVSFFPTVSREASRV